MTVAPCGTDSEHAFDHSLIYTRGAVQTVRLCTGPAHSGPANSSQRKRITAGAQRGSTNRRNIHPRIMVSDGGRMGVQQGDALLS